MRIPIAPATTSTSPLHTILDKETPDPHILAYGRHFYLTRCLNHTVEIYRSTVIDNYRDCPSSIIWRGDSQQPGKDAKGDEKDDENNNDGIDNEKKNVSEHDRFRWKHVWAPQLHRVRGAWYVYTSAVGMEPGVKDDGHTYHGLTRRLLVLRCRGEDPLNAADWELVGPIRGLGEQWAVDPTVFSLDDRQEKLYLAYSGHQPPGWTWDDNNKNNRSSDLFIWIMRLRTPAEGIPHTLACISTPTFAWEKSGHDGMGTNVGPVFVDLPNGGFRGFVFSANHAHTANYCLGLLRLIDPSHPTNPASWRKRDRPLLISDPAGQKPPFGPGSASVVDARDGRSVLCAHHAKLTADGGLGQRMGFVVRLTYDKFDDESESVSCADPN